MRLQLSYGKIHLTNLHTYTHTHKHTHKHAHTHTNTHNGPMQRSHLPYIHVCESAALHYLRVHLRLLQAFVTQEPKTIWRWKLTSIGFSRRGAEGSRSSWLQTLGNQLIDRSPYITVGIPTANVTGCITFLNYQ